MLTRFIFVLVLLLFSFGQTAHAGLAAVGSTNPQNGFPLWYQDTNGGLALQLCLEGDGMSEPCLFDSPVPGNEFSQRIGFGAEAFWWLAEASLSIPTSTALPAGGGALLTLALGARFANENPVNGNQVAFGRISIRIDAPVAGIYRVTHPFGSVVFNVSQPGLDAINFSDDVGNFSTPSKNFGEALTSNIGPFLVAVNPAPAEGFIGNPLIEQTVAGSPFDTNFFRIDGPPGSNLGGAGNDVVQTNLFSVTGKRFTGKLEIETTTTTTTVPPAGGVSGPAIPTTTTTPGTTTTTAPPIGGVGGESTTTTTTTTITTTTTTPKTTTPSEVVVEFRGTVSDINTSSPTGIKPREEILQALEVITKISGIQLQQKSDGIIEMTLPNLPEGSILSMIPLGKLEEVAVLAGPKIEADKDRGTVVITTPGESIFGPLPISIGFKIEVSPAPLSFSSFRDVLEKAGTKIEKIEVSPGKIEVRGSVNGSGFKASVRPDFVITKTQEPPGVRLDNQGNVVINYEGGRQQTFFILSVKAL